MLRKKHILKKKIFKENNNWCYKQNDFDDKIDNNGEKIIIINIKLIIVSFLNILIFNYFMLYYIF